MMIRNWLAIHSGLITRSEITKYVTNPEWQKVRVSMLGASVDEKYETLKKWLHDNHNSRSAQVQVTNYINALKRGGVIK